MKTLLFMVTLLAMETAALGMDPPEVEWVRTYFPGKYSRFYDVIETSDAGIVTAGYMSADFWETSDSCLVKYDSYGYPQWSASADFHYYSLRKVVEQSNGDIIAVGKARVTSESTYSLIALCVNSDGQTLWARSYEHDTCEVEAHSLCTLPDGGFAICGEIGPAEGMNQAWILRTDSQGDTLWTREWGWEAWDRARGVLCIDSVITVLCSGRLEGDPGGTYIVRYSLDGDLLSQYRIPEMEGEYGFDMREASDDGLLIVDNYNPLIVHTDYYGHFDWSIWAPALGQPYGWSIDTAMDGGFIYGGENRADEIWDACGMISRHNADGTELWRDYVYESGCLCIYSAHQLSQGGYIAAGYANPSSTDSYQGFLMKYSPEMGIGEPGDAELNLEVSPNPCASELSVSFSMAELGNASVKVYDLGGRLVSTVADGLFPAGSNSVEWAVPEAISSGCYFIQYNSDIGSTTRSIALIK